MCDTLVALGKATVYGVPVFAKNSDREPNEAQVLEFYPRATHDEEYVECTYVKVPQVKETYAVLISRPFWMWGAEMGVNEYGVAIGNEAVFTKEPYEKTGLTGMDMLRLALERSKTASEALKVILELLEKYGQGGNCGYIHEMYYHNSFIIADPREAWVLETAGEYWVAEKVKDVRSISNALSIGREWDRSHPRVVDHAVEKGWCRGEEDFDFARCYSDRFYTFFAKGRERRKYTEGRLREKIGEIDVPYVMSIMRSHHRDPDFTPSRGSMRDVCMHAGGITRPSQTAGSYIGVLYPDLSINWFTATSTPCISMYKPVFIPAGLPDIGPKPTGKYDPSTLWWRQERLHRAMLGSYRKYAPPIRSEIERIERELEKKALKLREAYVRGEAREEDLLELTREAFDKAATILEKYLSVVKPKVILNPLFAAYWMRVNREAGLRL